jgi:hypothetical protein
MSIHSHQISKKNEDRVVNFVTSENLVVKSTMFPHCNIHKYAWTSSEGKMHNQVDHILIERGWHSSILEVQSFRGTDCNTDRYLILAKMKETLTVSK